MRLAAGFVLNQELSRVVFYPPFIWIIVIDCLKEHRKGNGNLGMRWGDKTLLDLDYADDLSILDHSLSKMNGLLEVLRVQGARIALKNNMKKT